MAASCRENARENVKQLIQRKDNIEAEIKELYEVLDSQRGVGMQGPLIDNEGYPRSDIDVYTVRTARNKIICLQNDHKDLMKQIEQGLHVLHGQERQVISRNQEEKMETDSARPRPFAKIDTVSPGSPAAIGGLVSGDTLLKFGSVTTENFRSLQNIAEVVQHSQRRPVSVTVIRNKELIHLGITPQPWSGRGLIGCNIVPLSS
ncbi:26S proteasome non-ATPase regulatory subunit 9-like [Ptychodera flava]|uniref:26S proteasome non-ATPase regulatory subunit 9-like n=1 Tax=Ptychodera flava TaxID=63121 RepID=UPI00396AA113